MFNSTVETIQSHLQFQGEWNRIARPTYPLIELLEISLRPQPRNLLSMFVLAGRATVVRKPAGRTAMLDAVASQAKRQEAGNELAKNE